MSHVVMQVTPEEMTRNEWLQHLEPPLPATTSHPHIDICPWVKQVDTISCCPQTAAG